MPVLDESLNLTYTALSYANGPGAIKKIRTKNLTEEETGKFSINFAFEKE